jgi:hypothetical protein
MQSFLSCPSNKTGHKFLWDFSVCGVCLTHPLLEQTTKSSPHCFTVMASKLTALGVTTLWPENEGIVVVPHDQKTGLPVKQL